MKSCPACHRLKPSKDFYRNSAAKDGCSSTCKLCWDATTRERRQKDPEGSRRDIRDTQRRAKQRVIDAYGGKCACCGEDRLFFLSIDHVNGDGASERNGIRSSGTPFYYRLIRENFPQDGRYQVLCHNCNLAKGTKSACPCRNPQSYLPRAKGQLLLF